MRREMKKIAISAIMLLAALFCVSCSDVNEYPEKPSDYDHRREVEGLDYGELEEITYYSEAAGAEKHAVVLMPPDAEEDRRYPVLYLLHGLMCGERTWFDLCSAAQTVRNSYIYEDAVPMIVVGVNCVVNAGEKEPSVFSDELTEAYDKTGEDIVRSLKPYIDSHYPSLTGKYDTAVTGFSMGGREALLAAFTYQNVFGHVGAFSSASFNRNVVSVGVVDPVLDEFRVEEDSGGFGYILLMIGEADLMTGGVTQMYDAMMTGSGIEHDFYTTAGGHDFATWSDGLHTFVNNIFGAGASV